MPDLPHIALLVITYNRYDILKTTLNALLEKLIYPADKLHIVVSDDSTGGTYLTNLKRTKAYKDIEFISTNERSGWGKHVNGALQHVRTEYPQCDYVFQIEDDYELKEVLDLRLGAALMETRPNIGMLRYRGTAGTHCIYHQFEADIPSYELDRDNITYLQLDNASHTLWVYSNGPHLKRIQSHQSQHPDFHEHYGLYLEGAKLGATEENFAHRVKDGMKLGHAPAIAIMPEWVNMHFNHLGDSWQGSQDDISQY